MIWSFWKISALFVCIHNGCLWILLVLQRWSFITQQCLHYFSRSWDNTIPCGLQSCRPTAKPGQHCLCQLQTSVFTSRRCNNSRCCAGCLPRYPSHGCQPCLQVEPCWCCWCYSCCYCRSTWPSVTLTRLGECGCYGGQEYPLSSCKAKPVYATTWTIG